MSENERRASTNVPPGALTALLRDVFRSPPADGKAALPALRPGEIVGRFEVVSEIGRGGFGVVYEARDRELGRIVALKAVRMGGDVELKEERLLREAEAAAQLSHPNIVTLHDLGRFERGPYLVMERLRGQDLGQRLAHGALPVGDALRIATEMAKAVAHAHAHGVVHRDLTPGNVFLCSDGQVKVLDFGLAQAFGRHKVHGGTRDYMAPEQRRGAPEDERTDVFALGVILHQMLTGTVPFPDAAAEGAAPTRLAVDETPALGALVARMLEERPARRPRHGGEVLAALAAVADGVAPGGGRARRARSRSGVVAATSGAVAVAAIAILLSRPGAAGGDPASAAEAAPAVPAATIPVAVTAPAIATASGPAVRIAGEPGGRAVPLRTDARPAAPPTREAPARPRGTARDGGPAARPRVRECRDRLNAVPTPELAAGDGVLTVDADPFGEVWVDGVALGETPRECRVAAGAYVVRTVHPEYGAREARIDVRAGERARWTADYPGWL